MARAETQEPNPKDRESAQTIDSYRRKACLQRLGRFARLSVIAAAVLGFPITATLTYVINEREWEEAAEEDLTLLRVASAKLTSTIQAVFYATWERSPAGRADATGRELLSHDLANHLAGLGGARNRSMVHAIPSDLSTLDKLYWRSRTVAMQIRESDRGRVFRASTPRDPRCASKPADRCRRRKRRSAGWGAGRVRAADPESHPSAGVAVVRRSRADAARTADASDRLNGSASCDRQRGVAAGAERLAGRAS